MKKAVRFAGHQNLLLRWLLRDMGEEDIKPDFIKYLIYAQSECDETIVHLDFLFETESLKDTSLFKTVKREYDKAKN